MHRVTVIGKNGFLARALRENARSKNWRYLDHATALGETDWIADTDLLINCALHPDLKNSAYEPMKDVDFLLSGYIQNKDIHYIMLSSRAVYGAAPADLLLRESQNPAPDTPYAENKYKTEQALAGMLPPERLTILRLGNIFGAEKGRKSFFGQMLEGLIERGVITLDIAADAVRDFLPAARWAEDMARIAAAPASGVYNIGSGIGITTQELTDWVIGAYGGGRCDYVARSYNGQFILDVAKARAAFALPDYNKAELKADIYAIIAGYPARKPA